jgi:hypothetical protein
MEGRQRQMITWRERPGQEFARCQHGFLSWCQWVVDLERENLSYGAPQKAKSLRVSECPDAIRRILLIAPGF